MYSLFTFVNTLNFNKCNCVTCLFFYKYNYSAIYICLCVCVQEFNTALNISNTKYKLSGFCTTENATLHLMTLTFDNSAEWTLTFSQNDDNTTVTLSHTFTFNASRLDNKWPSAGIKKDKIKSLSMLYCFMFVSLSMTIRDHEELKICYGVFKNMWKST